MKTIGYVYLLLCAFHTSMLQAQESEISPKQLEQQQQYEVWASNLWDSMDRITGNIQLPNNVAELTVPENFYYLSASDVQRVLE